LAGIILLLAINATSAGYLEEIEQGYEVEELRVVMNGSDHGYIVARMCDNCEEESLQITAATRLYKGRTQVPLADILKYRAQPAVVFREHKSNRVTRVRI